MAEPGFKHTYLTPKSVLNLLRGYLHFFKDACYLLVDFQLLGYRRESFFDWRVLLSTPLCFHYVLLSPTLLQYASKKNRQVVNSRVTCMCPQGIAQFSDQYTPKVILLLTSVEALNDINQGCQTHFHQGPHQPPGCFQRDECNFRAL